MFFDSVPEDDGDPVDEATKAQRLARVVGWKAIGKVKDKKWPDSRQWE